MIVFERKHWQVIIGSLVAILIIGILFFLFILRPTDVRIDLLTEQSQNIEKNERLPIKEEVVSISENELALLTQKVPLAREEDSIILDLEKSALASDTLLDSIVFHYDGFLDEQQGELEDQENRPTNAENEVVNGESQSLEEVKPIAIPEGLQLILVELTIQSKDYESMLLFIQEMEKLNRVYAIKTFAFTGFSEGEERVGPMEDVLTYSIQLVTYYAPNIALTVENDVSPSSQEADKTNPLQDVKETEETSESPSGPVSVENSIDEGEGTTQEPILQQIESKTHVVKKGETLFSISMDYYGKRNGELVIRKANNKQSNTVYVGEVLRIP
ncbi:MAG: LysM peptidoglycan-binding domain-containing protein [Paenisporosarcina sp.]